MTRLPLPLLIAVVAALPPALSAQTLFRTTRHAVQAGGTPPYDFALGDVDGDGDPDLVRGCDHDPNQLLLNDGRGRFIDATAGRLTTPPNGATWGNATYRVDLADIDGDGDLDLLLCNDHSLPNRVHVNDGTGVFTDVSATALPQNAFWSVDQVVGDFDGDGDVDWLVFDLGTGPRFYRNNGLGVFTDDTATSLAGVPVLDTFTAQAVDLDGDGDLDVLASAYATTWILLNQGNAVFGVAPPNYLPVNRGGVAFAADLDGDGRPEILMNSARTILRNLGGGTWLDVTATTLPAGATRSVIAFDFDMDGDLDLAGDLQVLRNDGGLSFTRIAVPGLAGLGLPWAVDVDGDLDLDLIHGAGSCWVNFARQVDTVAEPRIGQTYVIDYHLGSGGAGVIVPAIGSGAAALPLPPFGTLRLAPGFTLLGVLTTTAGQAQIRVPVPINGSLVGLRVDHQALLLDPARPAWLSNAVADTVRW